MLKSWHAACKLKLRQAYEALCELLGIPFTPRCGPEREDEDVPM